jgi:RNA polymerase sigma-70 factor (ECF subfamily)
MDLTALINTYRGPLTGLIASWGAPWGDAIEIAQDSLTEAWFQRQSCRGDWSDAEVFGRWLRGVARNRFRNWTRGRRRERLRVIPLGPAVIEQAVAPCDPVPSERLESLRRAIERLPVKQRQVVLMHYLEETSVKEIAALLSLPAKTIEGRLYQARATLARMLGKPPTSQIEKMLIWL